MRYEVIGAIMLEGSLCLPHGLRVAVCYEVIGAITIEVSLCMLHGLWTRLVRESKCVTKVIGANTIDGSLQLLHVL